MAIEFEHRGKKYRADTAREAAELQFRLEEHDALHGTYGSVPSHWTADLAMDLLGGIGELQKKFLTLLVDGKELKSSALVAGLGLDSEIALAGVVSGFSKQLRKMSINPYDVYQVSVQWKHRGKERFFKVLPHFRDVLTELGWPEAWEEGVKKK